MSTADNADHRESEVPAGADDAIAYARLSTRKKVLFAGVVVLGVLLSAELVCRLLGPGAAGPVDESISDWQRDPDGRTFWVLRASGFNSDGLRDREHQIEKPDGVHRIVCLGDSVTYGDGVKANEAYSAYLESFLKQLGLPVEVFNVAIPGWSTLQQVAAYRSIVRRYKPDHIFLGFCLNDVGEMHNNLIQRPSTVVRFASRYSSLARQLVGAEGRQIRRIEELLVSPDSQSVAHGWELVFSELTELQRAVSEDGSTLSVLIFPFRFQLDSNAPMPIAQQKLSAFCLANDIPCLDLLPDFKQAGPSAFHDEYHLSPFGAQIVAQRVVRWGQSGCVWCGYDLENFAADRCPRCGRSVNR